MTIKSKPTTLISLCLILAALLFSATTYAEINPQSDAIGKPDIGIHELTYRLTPLTKADLVKTADRWIGLLQQHLQTIALQQIKISNADEQSKQPLLEQLNRQNEQKIKLIDRTSLVLKELQHKGGDIKEYQDYIDAVSGPKVDIHDTDTLAATLTGWLKSPEGGLRWASNITFFLLTLFVFKILAGIFGRIAEKSASHLQKSASDLLKHFFVNLVKNLTKAIGFMVALSMLEINIAPLVAALGATGFIIGFALQGTLSNFASGLMILIYRPYDIGDVVNVAGTTGKVNSMTLVSTTLKLPDNQQVVIPNNAIWGSTITNVTGSETRRVDMVFGIGYNDDIDAAEKVLSEIVKNHPLVHDTPEPVIKVHELADSSVNFVVRPWANTGDYFAVISDITRSVKKRFDEAGISIPYPQQDIHLFHAEKSA